MHFKQFFKYYFPWFLKILPELQNKKFFKLMNEEMDFDAT